jgi:hypothetical protein
MGLKAKQIKILKPYIGIAFAAVRQGETAAVKDICRHIKENFPLTESQREALPHTIRHIAHNLRHGETFQVGGQARQLKSAINNQPGKRNINWELL